MLLNTSVVLNALWGVTTASATRRRSLLGPLLVVAAVHGAAGSGTAAGGHPRCGFWPVPFHEVVHRTNIDCSEAKRVLLSRGKRDTIPMVCGRPRTIRGWRLENTERSFSSVTNRYTRGMASFIYDREQNAYRQYCPPKVRSSEHV